MLSCSLLLYPNSEKRVFHPISKLWEILYQTRERVFRLVSHHWVVAYSNTGRSDLFDIQTSRNDIPQMRMSVSPDSQPPRSDIKHERECFIWYPDTLQRYITHEKECFIGYPKKKQEVDRECTKNIVWQMKHSRMLDIVSQIINNRNVVGWDLRISIPKFVRARDLFWCSFMN